MEDGSANWRLSGIGRSSVRIGHTHAWRNEVASCPLLHHGIGDDVDLVAQEALSRISVHAEISTLASLLSHRHPQPMKVNPNPSSKRSVLSFVEEREILVRMNKSLRRGTNANVTKRKSSGVDEYIAKCPKEARGNLAKIRAAIRAAVPVAIERTDYFRWPGYADEFLL